MNDTECASADKFRKKHVKCGKKKTGVNGAVHIEYIFLPTSIGDCISIKCTVCNTEENITDF
jgi:hypothetical protein